MKTSHTRSMLVCFVVVSVLSGAGTGFCGTQLTHGPLVAAVTDNLAKVWVRTDQPTNNVKIKYMPDDSSTWLTTVPFETLQVNDLTVAIPLSNLESNMWYRYTVLIDDVETWFLLLPKFHTFPAENQPASFKFGVLSDVTSALDAPALGALAADNPDFVVILGDYNHSNPGEKADVLTAARTMHKGVRHDDPYGPDLQDKIFKHYPVAHVWDDHDYCCNNSDKTFGNREAEKALALQAFDEYWPSYDRPNPSQGLWHSFTYGSLVEVFVLDLRSQRDLNSNADDDPCNPQLGAAKSMLDGDRIVDGQKAWLKAQLLASTATWKFLLSTVPWNRTVGKDDAWFVFQCEQRELLASLVAHNITGVVVLSGDIHTGGAIDNGTNAHCPEMSVPTTNVPPPNTCQGMCGEWTRGPAGTASGYSLVSGSATEVTLKVKGENGANRFLPLTLHAPTFCTSY